jgi:hypothetical protein
MSTWAPPTDDPRDLAEPEPAEEAHLSVTFPDGSLDIEEHIWGQLAERQYIVEVTLADGGRFYLVVRRTTRNADGELRVLGDHMIEGARGDLRLVALRDLAATDIKHVHIY